MKNLAKGDKVIIINPYSYWKGTLGQIVNFLKNETYNIEVKINNSIICFKADELEKLK